VTVSTQASGRRGYRASFARTTLQEEEMAVKLHRCSLLWLRGDWHPCHRVQKALDEAGVDYEIVKAPILPRGRRKEVERLSGQVMLPVIEFEDGTAYREESADMAARIREGKLFAQKAA
jgi:glutaredoxin